MRRNRKGSIHFLLLVTVRNLRSSGKGFGGVADEKLSETEDTQAVWQ